MPQLTQKVRQKGGLFQDGMAMSVGSRDYANVLVKYSMFVF